MAEKTKVSLCADLLRAVFKENEELLLELQLRDALGQYEKAHPVLGELKIGNDLSVDAVSMPDTENAIQGIEYLLRKVQSFMEIFVGAEEAERRIYDAAARFETENPVVIKSSGLVDALPQYFSAKDQEAPAGVDDATDMEKARQLFSDIFTSYLQDDPDGGKKRILFENLNECNTLTSVSDDAAWFEFTEGASLSTMVDQLSGVVDNLNMSTDTVKKIIEENEKVAGELGIINKIFRGVLSPSTTFGVKPIDTLLRSGIERDATLLLEGPAVVEKDVLCNLFLKKGLDENGCVIYASTLRSPERLKNGLASIGVDVTAAESEGRLIIVDWFTRHRRQITGIEESDSVIMVSNDLTNLAVGIDIALKKAVNFAARRVVLDMVSPTIMVEGFERVNEFLNAVKAKLKTSRSTGLITLNPLMHTHGDIDMIEDKFDGTLSLSRSMEDGRLSSELHVSSLAAGPFDSSHILLDINDKGMALSDTDRSFTEEERIPFDQGDVKSSMGFPGIENITAGGLPTGRSFLIWISSKMTSGEIIKPLLFEAVGSNHAVVLALSTVPSSEISDWLGELEHNTQRLIEKGDLEIVEWQAQKDSRILGVEEDDGIIKASKDITHLGVGFDLALRKINEDMPSVAVVETLSPAFRMHDFRTVYPFAQTINARLGRKGFTSFVIMERDVHDPLINAGIEEVFDGVLDIMDAGTHLELAVLNLKDAHFLPEYRKLSRLRSGFSVDLFRREPEERQPMALPDEMTPRIERLDRELKEALEEKSTLEKRTTELMNRESELQRKHDELRLHLVELEKRIGEQQKEMADTLTVRSEEREEDHRKELAKILAIMDDMLEHLPEELINEFANSEEYKLYERILDMYLEDKE